MKTRHETNGYWTETPARAEYHQPPDEASEGFYWMLTSVTTSGPTPPLGRYLVLMAWSLIPLVVNSSKEED